jgi:hypothetical protein
MWAEISQILTVFSTVCAVGALVWVILLLRQLYTRGYNTQADLANMMILFQTMRDVLREQKTMAQQLNKSLDRKVAYIKKITTQAVEDIEKLRESERSLADTLEHTRSELAAVQRGAGAASPAAEALLTDGAERDAAAAADSIETPVLSVLPRPEPVSDDDIIDSWAGLDFAEEPDDLPPMEVDAPPEKPGDADAARAAFRALLDMGESWGASGGVAAEKPAERGGDGNGRRSVTPLQARVYEYSDAGMTVPQIARELGIGKGEVRLILSLRQNQDI